MSAQELWDAALPLIQVIENHPFLLAMVDGTLPLENFQYYIRQDALYLHDFADCLDRLSRNPGVSQKDKALIQTFVEGTQGAELDLHKTYFNEWKISASSPTEQQMPHTLLYTSYAERIIATQSHAQGLAILLPCYALYLHVGNGMLKLRDELGTSVQRPPIYDRWIDMYKAGSAFEERVGRYKAMVDAACQSATAHEFAEMKRHFLMACKLEHMFWDQAMTMMQWPTIV